MSSSYNNTISSSFTQPFLIPGANNFNREETVMNMVEQPNTVAPPPKKRRNKAGNPNPDAEIIALSPKSIMATNRFICEVCNKGFQREQNLQLHRRGHNLPWKLKQSSKEVKKRKVYLCPEPTCAHHDPSRALGDLTGIKKHYYRKHGEKKWKCQKCSKLYAVQSDWKAHSKICGTKEYRCDCSTIFSRRDSYITHRAFCDALIRETARNPTLSFTETSAAIGEGFYGRLDSNPLSNSGFTPLAASYNLNPSSTDEFEGFIPQSTNPNIGYNKDNTARSSGQYYSVPSIFTNDGDNNDPSTLLRGLPSSFSSSVIVNNFRNGDNGNLQGQYNSLAVTTEHQGRSGSIFDLHFGSNNLSMGGSDRLTLDFLGVNGRTINNVNGRGGLNRSPLDVELKFSHPNHPFRKA